MNKYENFSLLSDISTPVPLLWQVKNPSLTDSQVKSASTDVLLTDSYPLITKNQVNFKDEWQKWWHYPIFKEGSYAQVTNNLRYQKNPDIATCSPQEFCGAFYHNNQYKSNLIYPLPQVPLSRDTDNIRVGWWNTSGNLLPFANDVENVLY